ncbi:RluA family pseudouridine synthase [Paenibacillus sp. PL2-23]|uniref:RluA family pseudouridine synthase n=1 Tax=Paenibacillus sp. PL2-23 TaxID=2100729 RepID=UPI0030F5EBF3
MLENYMTRSGEWLLLDGHRLSADPGIPGIAVAAEADSIPECPQAGSHPHNVRQWLLASSFLPGKWINRLFSVGGIQWRGEQIGLRAFAPVDAKADKLYRQAAMFSHDNRVAGVGVLYEDDYCLVLNKPAGMPVHPSFDGETGTLDHAACRHMLEQSDLLPVRHIHRLDDDTTGPVLYAKNDLAQLLLDEAMREKRIDRRYVAAVQGKLKQRKGVIDAPIAKDRHHRSRRRVAAGGEAALTRYEVLQELPNATLVRLQLETGRTHQIRVHMSYLGHPLLGDALYGGPPSQVKHQALHGERLVFPHPLSGRTTAVEAPWPAWLKDMYEMRRL